MSNAIVYGSIQNLNDVAGIGSGTEVPKHSAQLIIMCGVNNGSVITPLNVTSTGELIVSGA